MIDCHFVRKIYFQYTLHALSTKPHPISPIPDIVSRGTVGIVGYEGECLSNTLFDLPMKAEDCEKGNADHALTDVIAHNGSVQRADQGD